MPSIPPPDDFDLSRWGSVCDQGLWGHATAVAVDGTAAIILGPSGSGKSRLAFDVMAFGAKLICDDAILLQKSDAGLRVLAPPQRLPLIEARGIGLLRAGPMVDHASLGLVISLGAAPPERLPPRRYARWDEVRVPFVAIDCAQGRASVIIHVLRHGFAPEA